MSTPCIADLVDGLNTLPSLPSVVAELLETMGRDDVNIDRLARGVGKDQALAARTLRVANSPFYGMQGRIDTIGEAITVLGFVNVRSLVMTSGISAALPTQGAANFDPVVFWRHALGVAACARALAALARQAPEKAFLAGLLHDIGRLVLVSRQPAAWAEVTAWRRREDCPTLEAERAVLGFDHAEVGRGLCRHWRIPEPITSAVAGHHAVDHCAGPASMADVIHVSDAVAHALDLAGDPSALVPPPETDSWRRLGIDAARLDAVLANVVGQFEGMVTLLGEA